MQRERPFLLAPRQKNWDKKILITSRSKEKCQHRLQTCTAHVGTPL